jgi:hypothetical protein
LSDGKRSRRYRLKPLNPVSQAIYDCVEARIMASIDEEFRGFDWNEILKKAPRTAAETPTVSSVEGGQVLSGSTIYNLGVPVQNQGEGSELEQLLEAMPFCESAEDLATVIEGVPLAVVGEAIFMSSDQSHRKQLEAWLEALNQPVVEVEPQLIQIKVGDRLSLAKDLFTTTKGKVVVILEWFGDSGRTNGGLVALSEIQSGIWQFMPSG